MNRRGFMKLMALTPFAGGSNIQSILGGHRVECKEECLFQDETLERNCPFASESEPEITCDTKCPYLERLEPENWDGDDTSYEYYKWLVKDWSNKCLRRSILLTEHPSNYPNLGPECQRFYEAMKHEYYSRFTGGPLAKCWWP